MIYIVDLNDEKVIATSNKPVNENDLDQRNQQSFSKDGLEHINILDLEPVIDNGDVIDIQEKTS